MHVIGTAGHVDHGKSTLVKALTGIDPDRLKEEQQRAMTIELGFAWLTLSSGESVGLVDVPGHQDFIKNMLAGVGGIEAALLVIAADEGVMPQTREHLAILDLLEIPRGIIVLTKIDLVDHDWLELVQADIMETVADTVLARAPIVPVSAVKGTGLSQLRQTIRQILEVTPPRLNRGRPRLSIDRVFSMSGFGTVVTGTLLDGQLSVGQEVEILPHGLKSRIRGLQSHKQKVTEAQPGSRVAVNLTGLNTTDLQRGDVLTLPGWLEPTQLIDTYLELLPKTKKLHHNQEIELFTGATEVLGFTRLLGTQQLESGQEGWVQIRLAKRIAVTKGDRFIIRQPSPSLTIGGGVIVDPLPRRRHRRFRAEIINHLETLLAGTPADLLLNELDRRGPLLIKTLFHESGLPTEIATATLKNLLESSQVFFLDHKVADLVASPGGWATLFNHLKTTLSDYHQRFPLRLTMPKSELKSRLKLETRLFNEALQYSQHMGLLVMTDTGVRLPEHQVKFTPSQQTALDHLLAELVGAPYNTPLPKEITARLGEEVLVALLENGQLMRLSDEVILLGETYHDFTAWLTNYLRQHQTINVAQVRDTLKTSRKYALALLEYTDAQRLTRRIGDERVLRE